MDTSQNNDQHKPPLAEFYMKHFYSGWAFVPICHGAAITIPFSTLFVFKLKRLDVTVNLTSSAGCLCSSITLILQN